MSSPRRGPPPPRTSDDAGGVWIVTGIVMGVIVYAGMVIMLVAGFTPVTPLVVIPPVLLALVAGNSLIGGGRSYGRSAMPPSAGSPAPRSPRAPELRRPGEPVRSADEHGEP